MNDSPRVHRWTRTLFARALSVVVSILVALILGEVLLQLLAPCEAFQSARELPQFRNQADSREVFTIDPEFGFRPILGKAYDNEDGTQTNRYTPDKEAGLVRLLFVGDSVTARGALIESLRQEYGEAGIEYWNAGVESFNTIQEVAFYRRYNARLNPDHVILIFHLNDFETTPVAFLDRKGDLV